LRYEDFWVEHRLFSAIVKTFRLDRIWLEKHDPDAADPGNATIWRQARDSAVVGEKARELFGPDVIWPRAQELPDAAVRIALDLPQQGRIYC